MDKNTLRSKFHPPHRDITFVASDKSPPSRVNPRWLSYEKEKGLLVCLKTVRHAQEMIYFFAVFYNDEITSFFFLFEMSTMRYMIYLVEI